MKLGGATMKSRKSDAQEAMLQLLEQTNVNNLAGERISRDLRNHEALWRSAYFTSASIERNDQGKWVFGRARRDFISLRDLPTGGPLHWDTLLLLAVVGEQDALMRLASTWGADIAQWIDIAEAGRVMGGKRSVLEYSSDPSRVILYLWWD
jgi:hypothetical protein